MGKLASLRVLIVEDDYLVTVAVRQQIRELGCEVVGEAIDGLEALEMAEALQPDVILMDVRMPRMDEIEATRRLMARASIPVIILTGDHTSDVFAAAKAAGACACLGKLPSTLDMERVLGQVRQGKDDQEVAC